MVDRIKKSWICYCLVGHPLEHSSALLILQLCMEVIDVSTTQSKPAVTIHAVTDATYSVHVPLGKLSKLFGHFHLAKLKFCLHPPTETRRFWLCWSKRPHIKRIKQPWIFCCCLDHPYCLSFTYSQLVLSAAVVWWASTGHGPLGLLWQRHAWKTWLEASWSKCLVAEAKLSEGDHAPTLHPRYPLDILQHFLIKYIHSLENLLLYSKPTRQAF